MMAESRAEDGKSGKDEEQKAAAPNESNADFKSFIFGSWPLLKDNLAKSSDISNDDQT